MVFGVIAIAIFLSILLFLLSSKPSSPKKQLNVFQMGEEATKQRIFNKLGLYNMQPEDELSSFSLFPGTYWQNWSNGNEHVTFMWLDRIRDSSRAGKLPSYVEDCYANVTYSDGKEIRYFIKNPWSSDIKLYVDLG